MTTIRGGFVPTTGVTQTNAAERSPTKAPAANPEGWEQFQDAFSTAPATAIESLRQRATELGRPDVVAPLSGLSVTDDAHHSVASNTLRNYPVKDIYAELYTETAPVQDNGLNAFMDKFYKTPGTALAELRNKANEIGRPEAVQAIAGLILEDGGHFSGPSNAVRNYPIAQIYQDVYGNS